MNFPNKKYFMYVEVQLTRLSLNYSYFIDIYNSSSGPGPGIHSTVHENNTI